MAQFRGTVQGNRSETSRLGHKTTGLTTECNGWNIGVKCIARYNEKAGVDEIMIYETSGSGYGGEFKHIHTVFK